MRRTRASACGAVALLAASLPAAHAQVRTDTGALDALAPAHRAAPGPSAHHPRAAAHPASRAHAPAHGSGRGSAHAGPPARVRAPAMAAHPPPPPVIAPPAIHVPTHPPPPPPPVPVDPKAPGRAAAIDGGTRLTFGTGSAAINPAMMAALHAESAAMKSDPDDVATIDAYAAGTADDPSTTRRLSLQRALVARAVLINDGVPSTRIYARALGVPPATTNAAPQAAAADAPPAAATSMPSATDASTPPAATTGAPPAATTGAPPPDRLDLTLAPLGAAAPSTGSTAGAGNATR